MDLHAAPIEWVLIVSSVFGVVINAMLLRSAIHVQDRLRLDNAATPPELIIAAATVRQESLRIGKHTLICMAGCLSIFLPPPPPNIIDVPQVLVTFSTLIAVSLLMSITSLLERSTQKAVEREATTAFVTQSEKVQVALEIAVTAHRQETADIAEKLHDEATVAADEFRGLVHNIDKKIDVLNIKKEPPQKGEM